uniref:Uncharacterized protein n=1 Tax=Aegilops tauschii subsp. strangulata TaxID=200361 RepID=A0A453MSV1_AEGTS
MAAQGHGGAQSCCLTRRPWLALRHAAADLGALPSCLCVHRLPPVVTCGQPARDGRPAPSDPIGPAAPIRFVAAPQIQSGLQLAAPVRALRPSLPSGVRRGSCAASSSWLAARSRGHPRRAWQLRLLGGGPPSSDVKAATGPSPSA